MAVQTAITQPIGSVRVGILGMALIAATAFSAGIGLGVSSLLTSAAKPEALTQAAPAFDAAGFRLGEKLLPIQAAPAFDAAGFRLGEKLLP